MEKNVFICIMALVIKTICCRENPATQGKFPDMFSMDDYYACEKNKENSYCTGNMHLIPKDVKSVLWKDMEDWSAPRYHFNYTVIHRTLCIPGEYKDYLGKKAFLESKTNEELKVYNLSAEMFSLNCKKDYFEGTDATKVIIGVITYMGFIVLATICDIIYSDRIQQSTIGTWLICFSLTSNWKKITNDKNPDYQRLKCIQGIRTYQSFLVTSCHVLMASCQLYLANPSFIEEVYKADVPRTFLSFLLFIMQTYFVLSAWLLTNQVLELFKRNGRFSVRDGIVLFLHRVARFWAPLIVMRFIQQHIYLRMGNGPGTFNIADRIDYSCRNNFWFTFFHLTNFIPLGEVCNLGMWSLTVDTQWYIVSIVFLYMALNFQLDIKKGVALMFIVTYIVNANKYFQNELPLFSLLDLKHIKIIDVYNDGNFSTMYFGFWNNAASGLIGILFGYFYFLNKENTKIKVIEMLCGPIFLVIPITTVCISNLDTSRLVSVLLGPLLKPLFGFGIACGIYGMSRNVIQGWPKAICENRRAVLLGNFTFTTYMYHFFVVFSRGAELTTVIDLNYFKMVSAVTSGILKSFAIGIVTALVVEQPGINIKNMILPRIKRKKVDEEQSNGYNNKNK